MTSEQRDILLQTTMEVLALRLTGQPYAVCVEPWNPDIAWVRETDGIDDDVESSIWYLGGGYWRAKVFRDAINHMLMCVRLINPDRTVAEIHTVSEAMRILHVLPQDII